MSAEADGPQEAEESTEGSGRRILSASLSFLKILCIYSMIAGLLALDYYLFNRRGGAPAHPWAYYLMGTIPTAYSWALVTPFILKASGRWGFERGQWPRTLLCHLALLALVAPLRSVIDMGITSLGLTLYSTSELKVLLSNSFSSFLSGLPVAPVYYTLIAGLGYTATYYRKFRERELAASNLERALAQAHLETLKNQLNPHFLFNTLNAIGTLSRNDPEATKRMVTLLGGLLRRSLGSSSEPQEVPLRQEIDFVRQYLEIEQILYSDRLLVEVDVPTDTLDLPVPNFILQPIVENAIKHGIATRSGPGKVTVKARAAGQSLEVSVEDDGVGLAAGRRPEDGKGLGLTRERLRGLYEEKASLSLQNREGGGAVAVLRLPLPAHAPATMPASDASGREA